MDTPTRYVVDTSVAIKLFLDEPYSDRAHTLFEQPDCEFHIPYFDMYTNMPLIKKRGQYGDPL